MVRVRCSLSAASKPNFARKYALELESSRRDALLCTVLVSKLKFLAGSFSAVSKPNFARKYAFDSIFKLYKICILLHPCNLKFFAKNRFEKSAIFVKIQQNFANVAKFAKLKFCQISKMSAIFKQKVELWERCTGVHCVDLGESFPTSIYLQKSASIQPRTSPSKFGEETSIQYSFAS